MTLHAFKSSLSHPNPPDGLTEVLLALWYDGKNDWETAHNIAQDIHSEDGSWIHAYLHRKEGDNSNASYWYRRAGRQMPRLTLGEEWDNISEELLRTTR